MLMGREGAGSVIDSIAHEAGPPVAAPDFRHVETWIFDLDNTLYHADSNLFAQIESRMTEFIAHRLDVHPGEAYTLQHFYFRSYGSTLRGLMECDHVDPDEFLNYVHDVDLTPLHPEPALRPALERLTGRRAVFTNGSRDHAERVLKQIGLDGLWADIWDIHTIGFVPKPRPEAYDRIVAAGGFDPHAAAMFEDTARNLVPAHALGMTTILIRSDTRWSIQGPQVSATPRQNFSYEIDDLADFLQTIRL
jgi:putative hydrolase of the HAD superfamily